MYDDSDITAESG